jgi:quinol monooxygenase YgiN
MMAEDPVELTVVTMAMETVDAARLGGLLARYVVLTRQSPGCRNVDLCASATTPGRFLVIEKWEDAASQRAHFDAAETVTLAESCRDLLTRAPVIDLYAGISAHDLR